MRKKKPFEKKNLFELFEKIVVNRVLVLATMLGVITNKVNVFAMTVGAENCATWK